MAQKGDFQLSLGFIISVVFAVVLLSVAIVWLRGTITNIGGLTDDLTQQAQQALTDTFRSSTTTFSLFPNQYKLDAGKELIMSAGIKNSASDGKPHSFVVNVAPGSASSGVLSACANPQTATFQNCQLASQGGISLLNFMKGWATYFDQKQLVDIGQNGFFKISFIVPANAPKGTYLFTVTACYDATVVLNGVTTVINPTSSACKTDSPNVWGGSTQQVLLQVT